MEMPWWVATIPVWIGPAIFGLTKGSIIACALWDRHMQWFPKLPTFWFDHPKWAVHKLAVLSITLMLIVTLT